jgi:hypothetical protein
VGAHSKRAVPAHTDCMAVLLVLCCRSACQQYWWERFPAQGGAATTSYMFAFTDPHPANAGLLQHMARVYAEQLPTYLGEAPRSC